MRLKNLWIIYWLIFFFAYLPLTRKPDVFHSERVKGFVVETEEHHFGIGTKTETHLNPVVKYHVDSTDYWFFPHMSTNYLGLYQKGDSVTIIYQKGNPNNANIAGIIGYWVIYSEIAFALLIVCIATIVFSAIKNWKKMTYDGPENFE